MPNYKYICRKCDLIMQVYQSIKDEPLKRCSNCKTDSLQRDISGGNGVIFRGDGFYSKDYGGKNASDGVDK